MLAIHQQHKCDWVSGRIIPMGSKQPSFHGIATTTTHRVAGDLVGSAMDSQDRHFQQRLLALHIPEALQDLIGCARPHIPHKVQGVLCKVPHLHTQQCQSIPCISSNVLSKANPYGMKEFGGITEVTLSSKRAYPESSKYDWGAYRRLTQPWLGRRNVKSSCFRACKSV